MKPIVDSNSIFCELKNK